ncbi:sce7726 family protein [Neobacillus jeddahensis]|uniref:sce7726 family protein n=1 Tax=Neobacillus jeddahensis TaxID=1461580 RepID=UPI00058B3FCB|nr:sce7726 family protein [Neobacillus jeddahensis]
MEKLKDKDIRMVLLQLLLEKYSEDPETKIVHELGILHGQSRIDVAVINGILHGFEIKSESDNLLRLPSQMEDYNKVFNRMTIVTQRIFLEKVRRIIPKWWGIWIVTQSKGNLTIREIRKGRYNSHVDPESLSHLLWKDEAISILKDKGLHKGYLSKPRTILYKRLASQLEIKELQFRINEQLKQREGWKVL